MHFMNRWEIKAKLRYYVRNSEFLDQNMNLHNNSIPQIDPNKYEEF